MNHPAQVSGSDFHMIVIFCLLLICFNFLMRIEFSICKMIFLKLYYLVQQIFLILTYALSVVDWWRRIEDKANSNECEGIKRTWSLSRFSKYMLGPFALL